MKTFKPLGFLIPTLCCAAAQAGVNDLAYEASPLYYTTTASTAASLGDTAYNVLHRPLYGGDLSGVARLILNITPAGSATLCSGALLADGMHVLTAAHCVTNPVTGGGATVNFDHGLAQFATTPAPGNSYTGTLNPSNVFAVNIQSVTVNPNWTYDYVKGGYDLAILTLSAPAPVAAKRYDLYTGGSEIGAISVKSGWGTIGVGSAVGNIGSGWRMGQNTWDMNALDFWGSAANPNILMYDFDNGTATNDAFGSYFGPAYAGLGLGDAEVISAPGDSGGPTFINGKLAGITSFGITFTDGTDANGKATCDGTNPDFICGLNNSFGEFAGDTKVSAYAEWIAASVPEPGSYALMALGLLAVSGRTLRRSKGA